MGESEQHLAMAWIKLNVVRRAILSNTKIPATIKVVHSYRVSVLVLTGVGVQPTYLFAISNKVLVGAGCPAFLDFRHANHRGIVDRTHHTAESNKIVQC